MSITPAHSYLVQTVTDALHYADSNGIPVPLRLRARVRYATAIKAGGDLSSVNAVYHDAISETLAGFFEGGSVTGPRNTIKRAASAAFLDAFEIGYTEAGAELPLEEDALSWLDARLETEFGFISQLLEQAKEIRKDKEADPFTWATEKADGFTRTLQDIYSFGKLFAAKNKMLTFDGQDGSANNICQQNRGTCVRLKGKRHKASWWISRGLVPYRGNPNYDCGAWECRHYLRDDEGNRFTL